MNEMKTIKSDDVFANFELSFHTGKFFMFLYGEVAFSYSVYANIDMETFLQEIVQKYHLSESDFVLKEESSKNRSLQKIDYTSSNYVLKIKEKILLEIYDYKVVIWYAKDISRTEINEVVKHIDAAQKKKKHNCKFYMVSASNHSEYGFEFRRFELKRIKLDLHENYNDDFFAVDSVITSFLKDSKKNGIVLLHGKYGTGKTTYIRYLMSQINKRFIFLPINLMEALSAPSFVPFISKYKDSILVLEDCEDILMPRALGAGSNNALVNLLNLGDGLLSDALSLKLICTFNAELRQIDQAILRKGRLVARYEFRELDIHKAQMISEKLGYDEKIQKPMTLAEIYNKTKNDFGLTLTTKKVGF